MGGVELHRFTDGDGVTDEGEDAIEALGQLWRWAWLVYCRRDEGMEGFFHVAVWREGDGWPARVPAHEALGDWPAGRFTNSASRSCSIQTAIASASVLPDAMQPCSQRDGMLWTVGRLMVNGLVCVELRAFTGDPWEASRTYGVERSDRGPEFQRPVSP